MNNPSWVNDLFMVAILIVNNTQIDWNNNNRPNHKGKLIINVFIKPKDIFFLVFNYFLFFNSLVWTKTYYLGKIFILYHPR